MNVAGLGRGLKLFLSLSDPSWLRFRAEPWRDSWELPKWES